MRILAIDHFYSQDLSEIEKNIQGDEELVTLPYSFFRDKFLEYFPGEVLGTDFSIFSQEIFSVARPKWHERCRREVEYLRKFYEFDLLLLPSDTFPYLRDIATVVQALGISVVVAQKETTISPDAMEAHSLEIGKYFPTIADHMTVCSEVHRDYWLRAGTEASRITVTGQPRFDYYARIRASSQSRPPRPTSEKVVLFLSFMLFAYIPLRLIDVLSWKELRSDIESTLAETAETLDCHILVKPHPQQDRDDLDAMRKSFDAMGKKGHRLEILSGGEDTRQLIEDSDVVVGFQTTALMESLIAGNPTIYAGWGETMKHVSDALIPYESMGSPLVAVQNQQELQAALQKALLNPTRQDSFPEEILRQLGPLDGNCAKRTLLTLREWASRSAPEESSSRSGYALRRVAHSGAVVALCILHFPIQSLSGKTRRKRARKQIRLEIRRFRECTRLFNSRENRAQRIPKLVGLRG